MPATRDRDVAAFDYFAALCAATLRDIPAPLLPPGVDPAALAALATRHRIAAPVIDRLALAVRAVDPAIAVTLTKRARSQRIAHYAARGI